MEITKTSTYYFFFLIVVMLGSCKEETEKKPPQITTGELIFNSSDKELDKAFSWAKNKALSYAHDNDDPVGYWYEAALPDREAFCMRDVSHQAIGAEILGLGKHNYNMFLKFAQNISKEKDYCSYWEINRYDKPAPVDYENDKDFWYNLPANFDVTYNAHRLYNWTGNKEYLNHPDLVNFYELSLNEYLDHWQLGWDQILDRSRSLHAPQNSEKSRFGNKRGIPTYNEGGRGETLLGIDMSASIVAAYKAYAEMLKLRGNLSRSTEYLEKAQQEKEFLNHFWYDKERQEYRSILYDDGNFDYFMVGENQGFLHYLFYYDVISDDKKIENLVGEYEANFNKLIVELKSYLPIIFYENGRSGIANQMIIDLCSKENARRDYPENSYTVIEHLTRGLMGINVDAASNSFSSLPRLEKADDWAEMKSLPLLSNKVTVKHYGKSKTEVNNLSGGTLNWTAKIPGIHEFLFLNGEKTNCTTVVNKRQQYSYITVALIDGTSAAVSTNP
ncbi:hypothetical protein [Arenibacter sp. F20364]|uniref:hypothetical protein n=1 Tax=Arenibacter sp. F20364 TaxID=2926415 RepID=UPI001FF35F30|nr:hypothetical protein [Arenibacter sp. F20364]MCK0192865.1 hypothetical protein [Arenibacter sp. F20364]